MRDAQSSISIEEAEDRIRRAFTELAKMALITRNDDRNDEKKRWSEKYSMHPLVHVWARERPKMRLSDQALWSDTTGRLLAASILNPPLELGPDDETYYINLLRMCSTCRIAGSVSGTRFGRTGNQ